VDKEDEMNAKAVSGLVKWIVDLEVVPRGWLTKLAGLASVLAGIAGMAGVGPTAAAGPEANTAFILGGLTSIGWKRAKKRGA
jgi:hypothetical protein